MATPQDFILGEFPRTLDERYRLSIPLELVEPLLRTAADCILAKERPGCLSLWNAAAWQARLDEGVELVRSKMQAGQLGRRLEEVQLLGRLLSTRHKTVQLAGRGRLSIPDGFREFLGVEQGGEVIVVGAGVCVEIWNPRRLAEPTSKHACPSSGSSSTSCRANRNHERPCPAVWDPRVDFPARVTRLGMQVARERANVWHGSPNTPTAGHGVFLRVAARECRPCSTVASHVPRSRACADCQHLRLHSLRRRPRDRCFSSAAPMKPANSGCDGRRLRLELRMELHGHEPGMVGQLDDLDQRAVGAGAGDLQAVGRELLAVDVVELVAVAVPLGDLARAVARGRVAAGRRAASAGRRAASCRPCR